MIPSDKVLDLIASPDNLLSAWRSVRGNIPRYRRMRSSGPDGVSLDEFERDLSAHLQALRHQLMDGRYEPQPPGRFKLPKRNGGQREIAVLTINDRVAQRAAQQILEPLWEPTFLPCSYGFRPGRSVDDAISEARLLRGHGNRWVVDGDISACFDRLDHTILVKRIERKISDRRVLDLLNKWLDAGLMTSGSSSPEGTPLSAGLRKTLGRVKEGWLWVSRLIVQSEDPYQSARYERYPMADESGEDENMAGSFGYDGDLVRERAARQLAAGGLMLAGSWIRPGISTLARTVGTAFGNPAGRRIIQRGLLATGGAAGVAAGMALAGYFLYQHFTPAGVGVLQGSPLSPLLANIYLHPFDAVLVHGGYRLVRFADDWVILCPDQEQSELAFNAAVRSLDRLHLQINREKTHILPPNEPLDWLGVKIQ